MSNKNTHKLPSGALQFTVFISVVIALILAGVLLLAYTHRFFLEQSKAGIDTIKLSDSGIEYLKKQQQASLDTMLLDVPEMREDQVIKMNLSPWGIFEKAYVKSTHRKKQFVKCALLGTQTRSADRPSIYLKETFNPLAVVGHSEIKGTAVLPSRGVRPGNIYGNSYYGKELIYGEVQKSDTLLPRLKYDYKALLPYYLYDYEPQYNTSTIPLAINVRITNSFNDPVKGYFTRAPLILEHMKLRGNIIIRSSEKITVRRSAQLQDIILAAPVIIIEDGVKGNFQVLADTTIKVGNNCLLSYPSALVMLEKKDSPALPIDAFTNKIFIGNQTTLKGSIVYFDTHIEQRDFRTNIFMSPGVLVKGEIYCEGNFEMASSSVHGTVYTKNTVTNEGGTTFVNHIYNATIDSSRLPELYGGILLQEHSKAVMKWLY